MNVPDLLPILAQLGTPTVLVVFVVLAWRLIDRGFELRVPPKRR